MLNFVRNQLIIPEKWGFEPGGEYANPTFKLTNRRKIQKDRGLQIRLLNREQNCSRRRLFTNCTPPYLTMFTILPDRGITKIAETVLVSAICGILPICSVIRLEPLNSDAVWWVSRSYQRLCRLTHLSITLILQCSSPNFKIQYCKYR